MRHGEDASSNKDAADTFLMEFEVCVCISRGFYSPTSVQPALRQATFGKKMPQRTYITKKSLPGHKPMKNRVTLLLCGDANGKLKLKPVLVYHSYDSRVFKKK